MTKASKVVALANGQAALQLGITGVPVEEVFGIDRVESRLAELMDSDAELVIANEEFRDQFSEWFQMRLAKHNKLPLIIFCPSFENEDAGTLEYINSIVKPAVGFEIRLD
jgi:vacuolar-type H+-ATPase subunit F/Vma7